MERRSEQGRPDESIFWHSYEMCQRKTNKGSCYNCIECDSVSGGAGLHIGPETAAGIGILPDTTPHGYTPIALALTGRKQCVLYSSLDAACSFFYFKNTSLSLIKLNQRPWLKLTVLQKKVVLIVNYGNV